MKEEGTLMMSASKRKRLMTILGAISVTLLTISGVATNSFAPTAAAYASAPTYRFQDSHWYQLRRDEAQYDDNSLTSLAAQQAAADAAYPATHVAPDQMVAARNAFQSLEKGGNASGSSWQLLGPTTTNTSAFWTYTGNPFGVSGRITALGIGSVCHPGDCRLYVGAAGGGVWRTNDALADPPSWTSVMNGLSTNAIGSLWVDPHNSRHVLAGTGEPNGSGDSEAGLGLFETWNAGNSWVLLPGSFKAAGGRSIGAVAVDPANPWHIFIGTDVARHGSSSVNGGRFTPPKAPQIGLYESTNGGLSFKLVFSKPSDSVNPASPNGSDFFRGGVTKIIFDPTNAGRVYFSMFDYGLFRGSTSSGYEQVFASAGGGAVAASLSARTEFDLAPLANGKLRIYLGDLGTGPADFYRVDDAGVPASALTDGTNNPGWMKLSSATNGTPGFGSFDFCSGQCSYDMVVASPAGHPDNVWISGQMQYGELLNRSNGRTVQRSTDAGVNFTDMTNDASFNGMHPDQHALVFDPENPDIAFAGSDGGLVRTSGAFTNQANDPNLGCAVRGLSGSNLTDCQNWLSAVPTHTFNMNQGLATLQFQSLSVNPQNLNDVIGGTQDNGTLFRQDSSTTWDMQVGGDGGQSGFNTANPNIIIHSYFGPAHDVNFHGGDPLEWLWVSDPLGNTEAASFYVPMIYDPSATNAGTIFEGEQHVWRTTDNGGDQTFLETFCNEFNFHPPAGTQCGDWKPLGGPEGPGNPGDLTSTLYGPDKTGSYTVALTRAPSNTGTLWVGTRRGRLFISTNADAADPAAVSFTRIDTPSTPTRFISGIAVDPNDPNHAFVSFSGYDAYAKAAGTAKGHVFDVHYNPGTGAATWKDISGNLGDQPITGIAFDGPSNGLYVSTDFGVLRLVGRGAWLPAASGLPLVAVYGLTLASTGGHTALYAATHGRSAYRIMLR
jgi:hypothetical protein